MLKKYNVSVVGAMGLVGNEMLKCLERRNFPVNQFKPLDAEEYTGMPLYFNGSEYNILPPKAEKIINLICTKSIKGIRGHQRR